MVLSLVKQSRTEDREGEGGVENLASDNGDGGEGLSEVGTVFTAIVAKHGADPLDVVHQADQALHGRHLLKP